MTNNEGSTQVKVSRIRAGLYRADVGDYGYSIEDYHQDGVGWVWRVERVRNGAYRVEWVGDYATKREAVAAIREMAVN